MSDCKCKVEAKPCAIPLVVPPERAQVLYLEEAEAARTAAQNAANTSVTAKNKVLEIAPNYQRAEEVLLNIEALEASASVSAILAGQKADSASESATSATTASNTAIEILRATQLIKNSGNADQLSTTNAADIIELKQSLEQKVSPLYTSKNLCNPNNICKFYIPNSSSVTALTEVNNAISYFVEIKPYTTYTITKSNGTSRFGVGVAAYLERNASAKMLDYSTSSTRLTTTVTTDSDRYKYLIIQVTVGTNPIFPQWIQVEEGEESTPYEEYNPYKDGETYCLKVGNSFEKVYTKEEIDKMLDNKSIFDKNANFGNVSGLGTYYKCLLATTNYNKNTMSSDVYNDFDRLALNHSDYIIKTDLGASSDGQHLYSYHFMPKYVNNPLRKIPKILIIAGQHGFEKGSVFALYHLLYDVCNNWQDNSILDYLRHQIEFIVVPIVNRYGFDNNQYKNANGVNLNRNYDTPAWELVEDESSSNYGGQAPFDQQETQIVRDLVLENTDATYFVDWHTNGQYYVSEYKDLNWITATGFDKDNYLSKVVDCAGYHIANITAHAVNDYNLIDIGDELCGYVTIVAEARPTAGAFARDNGVLAHTFETNNGIKGRNTLDLNCQKLGAEIFGNWLACLLYELSK